MIEDECPSLPAEGAARSKYAELMRTWKLPRNCKYDAPQLINHERRGSKPGTAEAAQVQGCASAAGGCHPHVVCPSLMCPGFIVPGSLHAEKGVVLHKRHASLPTSSQGHCLAGSSVS